MKANKLCFGLCSLFLLATAAKAQNPAEYIKWKGGAEKFSTSYQKWTPGNPLYTDSKAVGDDNFFISRIKPRARFRNTATQVDQTLTEKNDKNVFNWVPIGTTNGDNPNALPSGIYDSDVFSMWSYLTHYGNWTAPLVRMPGAFADVAHKNGVVVSVLSSIPWNATVNATDGSHGSDLAAMYNGGADKFIALLKQYGIDGWGMNSEFKTNSAFATSLQNFMADTYEKAITKGEWPSYAAAWYTLISNDGGLQFADGIANYNMNYFHKDGRGVSNYAFGNYGWHSETLQKNKTLAEGVGRSSLDVYAGMNLQGAQGKAWTTLAKYPTSIGLWGAHNMNMFYESRNELGANPEVKQATYLGRIERFFSNGNQNPAKKLEIKNGLTISYEGLRDFHGVSALSTAKSSLSWNLDEEAFFSFFNIGNGKFFKIKGETVNDKEWYNIGMQDYLPTWRYWFAKGFLGKEVADNGLKATFTWKDAWFGGSCLQVTGTSDAEYLHLFKTKFELKEGDKVRIRYKVVSGEGNFKLVASAEGAEADEQVVSILKTDDIDLGEWVEKVIEVKSSGRSALKLAGKTLAVVALKFEGAKDMNLRLGEFSILRGEAQKPAMPIVDSKLSKVLKKTYKGIDAKLIFNMEKPAGMADGEHIYNSDVKTAFFKVYIKQGDKVSFVNATTSWASILFYAPFTPGQNDDKVQLGVSAVGLDGVTESDIAWSSPKTVKEKHLSVSEEIDIDKPTIKPGQKFTVKFVDPNHPTATWEIKKNKDNTSVKKFTDVKEFSYSEITEEGLYDLTLQTKIKVKNKRGQLVDKDITRTLPGFIQISAETVGAMPEIKTLTFNGKEEKKVKSDKNKLNNLAYTGAKANGQVSRGLYLPESALGFSPANVFGNNMSAKPEFSFSFWLKFNNVVGDQDGIHLLNIRNPNMKWPKNNWGYIWSQYNPSEKKWYVTKRHKGEKDHQQNVYDIEFKPGSWTHITFTFKNLPNGNLLMALYINGKYYPCSSWGLENVHANEGDNTEGFSDVTGLDKNYWIMFGGKAFKRAGINGVLDDVKFYSKALTAEEVAKQMYSDTPEKDTGKEKLVGFWDFETDANADNIFVSKVGKGDAEVLVGKMSDNSAAGEGQTILKPIKPRFEAGSPYIKGDSYKVTTTAEWVFEKGVLESPEGTDLKGSAKVTYKKDGLFTGKLILSNSWGKSERTIKVINVGNVPEPNSTAVEELTDG